MQIDAASPAIELINMERSEQMFKHGKSIDHDRKVNTNRKLRDAANAIIQEDDALWPEDMDMKVFKHIMKKKYADRLVIAASLLAAEVDRVTK